MQIELRQLHDKLGMTTVYVTHDQREALTMSDRIAVIDRGRIDADRHAAAHSTSGRRTASSPSSSANRHSCRVEVARDGAASARARRCKLPDGPAADGQLPADAAAGEAANPRWRRRRRDVNVLARRS